MTTQNSIGNLVAENDMEVSRSLAGTPVVSSIIHSDNTAFAGNAVLQLTVGGTTSTGDPFVNFLVTGSTTYSFGIDNSDIDRLKLTNSTSPGVGDEILAINGTTTAQFGVVELVNRFTSAGGNVTVQTFNDDNSNAASHARFIATVGGASGGDAYIGFAVAGGTEWSFGLDNSDGDNLKLTTGSTPSAGTEVMEFIGNTTLNLNMSNVAHSAATVGGKTAISNYNTDNANVASHSKVEVRTGGAGGGDPYLRLNNNVLVYNFGIDNQDSDTLKITTNGDDVQGTEVWKMTPAGERTMPLQPAFNSLKTATSVDVTGDGTDYTIVTFTSRFDQNADFNDGTGTFTSPVTGRYSLGGTIDMLDIVVAHNTCLFFITTSNSNYSPISIDPFDIVTSGGALRLPLSTFADMDAADTAVLKVRVSGSTKTVDVAGGGSNRTNFWGHLAC